jgi:hypothetical protein
MLPTAKAADYITNLNVFNWFVSCRSAGGSPAVEPSLRRLIGAGEGNSSISPSQNGNAGKLRIIFWGFFLFF